MCNKQNKKQEKETNLREEWMVDGWIEEDGNERKASRNSNNELYSIIMFELFEPRSRDMRGKTDMLVLLVSQKVQVSKSIEVEKMEEKF